jgi:hypothetical protein
MTKFVNSFATNQLLPPWESKECTTWCFAVRLTKRDVSKYLDKYFNGGYPDPGPDRYTTLPSAQFGLIVICRQPKIRSQNREDPETSGPVEHTEVYFVIPVHRQKGNEPKVLVWVEPFVFGDNASVLFASREVCGMDMTLATVNYLEPKRPLPGLELDVIIDGIKKFDPHSRTEPLSCLRVSVMGQTKDGLDEAKGANSALTDFLDVIADGGFYPPMAPKASAPPPVELDHLKQFRDVYDFDNAIYRAIVASTSTYSDLDDVTYYDLGGVEIKLIWSDSVAETLESLFGFKRPDVYANGKWVPDHISMTPALAFSFKSTVTFDVLGTLHTYKATLTRVTPAGGAATPTAAARKQGAGQPLPATRAANARPGAAPRP